MRETVGEPYTGNPYVRFDEGDLVEDEPNMIRSSRVRRNDRILGYFPSVRYSTGETT